MNEARIKLKEARKIAARKKVNNNYDEFKKLRQRTIGRMSRGVPVDLPKMKSWDYAKGKVS